MFNLLQVSRIKKNQMDRKKGEDELVSEEWNNNDDDKFLTLRLFYTSHPWLLVTHGVYEVLKGPLVVSILDTRHNTVTIKMRDHAGRGLDCIKRKFLLCFCSDTEAKTFAYAHDLTLREHIENKHTKRIKEEDKAVEIIDLSKEDMETKAPSSKKRKLSNYEESKLLCIIESDMKNIMNEVFEVGDENNLYDDNFANTQPADDY